MSGAETSAAVAEPEPRVGKSRGRIWLKRLAWVLAIPLLAVLLLYGFLSTSIGKRFVADQIAGYETESGLSIEIGRIEGSLLGASQLNDVSIKDPKGAFVTIPEVDLDWRPLAWLWSGIDIRELTARRGRLERLPELRPGDPDAPILPDFDIRVDRLVLDNFVIAEGVASEQSQRVDITAKADIRSGRALIDAEGKLGRADRIDLLVDAEPDNDRFDLALDYSAPADGVIAGIAGLTNGYRAKIEGDGSWSAWLGHALITVDPVTSEDGKTTQEGRRFAALQLANRSGEYSLLGQVEPGLGEDSILGRALGETLSLAAIGTFEDYTFDGKLRAISDSLDAKGDGAVDLTDNRAEAVAITASLRDPQLFAQNVRFEKTRLTGTLNGPFTDLALDHRLSIGELKTDIAQLSNLEQSGIARFDGSTFTVPLRAEVARVVTGNSLFDPRLVDGSLIGTLTYAGTEVAVEDAAISFPGLTGRLAFNGDTAAGAYALVGPVELRDYAIQDVGQMSVNAKLIAKFGTRIPWSVRANVAGTLYDVANETVANVAGENLRFKAAVGLAGDQPIILRDVVLDSDRLDARFDSRVVAGSGPTRTTLAGSGQHVQYGDFTFDAQFEGSDPRAVLVLADPYPSAGLKDVRVALAPSDNGFAIDLAGQSLLGPFEGALGLILPANAATRIDIERLDIYRTAVSGGLTFGDSGLNGTLGVAGGGLDGRLELQERSDGAQGFALDLKARGARFGGATALSFDDADIFASGKFGGNEPSEIYVDVDGSGLEYGGLKVARVAAKAAITDGTGTVRGAVSGRRADRFALKFDGDIAPQRIAVLARGSYAGRRITMPRRAVLTALEQGGYRLAPTQIGYSRGYTILEGTIGGAATALDAKLANMPLRLIDLASGDLGFGGRMSGLANFRIAAGGALTGDARVKISDFTRSGLILSSKPADIYAILGLTENRLTAAARIDEDGQKLGRVDARITGIRGGGDLYDRIMRGRLNANVTFDGAAESLWRLAAIETFDLTGPVKVNARATGSLNRPRLSGTLASDNLRLQSAISGTDVTDISARGSFSGSRLKLTRFSGKPRRGGTISGSGTIDLAGISGSRGPGIDLRLAARNARMLDAAGLDATLTGPLRIVSNGVGGTIAGRVTVDRASWQLGTAAEDLSLPRIRTRETGRRNGAADTARNTVTGSWRYLVNANAPGGVAVDGLGLDSEWAANITLRGTVDDPRIGGNANLVRGTYTFAGARFDLTRGRITFNPNGPIDPQLDILAETTRNGTDVAVSIGGRSQKPNVTLSSTPNLPEEEILAQLLFGGSVTSLSATDGVQLAAALAALNGAQGTDPIGDLRRSIGLDQLRIVAADPTTGQGTGVALGKYLSNRVYVELVTDGQGYSATRLEYRVTSWLALLGTVSTIGRDSVLAEISRDY